MAGKTTLVKLLARFHDPCSCCVRIDGLDVKTFDPDLLRSRISFVFQNFSRYEATVADNIAYGDWRNLLEDRETLERVAANAGMANILQALPQGLDTVVGRKFGSVRFVPGAMATDCAGAGIRPASFDHHSR